MVSGVHSIPKWVNRRLEKLSPRARKYFLKHGLMPFAPVKAIAARAGISSSHANEIMHGLTGGARAPVDSHVQLYRFYQHAINSPTRKWVLQLPRFWYLHTLVTMAPTHGAAEIQHALTQQADGRPVPARHVITSFMKANRLNTKELRLVAGDRFRAAAVRRRKENNLSTTERRKLLFEAYVLLPKIIKKNQSLAKDELVDLVYAKLEGEVKYFDPAKMSGGDVSSKWERYLRSRIKYFVVDAIRQRLGRGQKRPRKSEFPVEGLSAPTKAARQDKSGWERLIRATIPGSIQRRVVQLLANGLSRAQVAVSLGMSVGNVYSHLSHARKRIKKSAR